MIKELLDPSNPDEAVVCTINWLFNAGIEPDSRRDAVDQLELLQADIAARIKELNADTIAELELGLDVPGFKLRAGSQRRTWRDESKVAEYLAKYNVEAPELYDMKLKSIPNVEKVLTSAGYKPDARETILAELIDMSVGAPSLVKEK